MPSGTSAHQHDPARWLTSYLWAVTLLSTIAFASIAVADSDADFEALITRVEQLTEDDKFAEALPLAKQSLAKAEEAYGPGHPKTARALHALAEIHRQDERETEAEPLHKRALAIRENVWGPQHPDTAASANCLALLYLAQQRFSLAEPLFKRALAIREKVFGSEAGETAQSISGLGGLYHSMGRYAEAEPLQRRALAIIEKVHGSEHRTTAESLNELATLVLSRGRYAEAESLFKRAIAIGEKHLGSEHRRTAYYLNNLGALYYYQGRYAESDTLYKRSLAIRERIMGPEHPDTANSLVNLGQLRSSQARYTEAESLLRRALAIHERAGQSERRSTAASLNNLGVLYDWQGRYAEAAPLYERALAINEKLLGPNHPSTASALQNMAGANVDQERYAEAEPQLKRALAIRETSLGPEHPDTATSVGALGGFYYMQGRFAEAEPLLKRALAIRERVLGTEHPATAEGLGSVARVYVQQRRYAEAELLIKRGLAVNERSLGPDHPETADSLVHLGGVYASQGRLLDAEELYERALAIRERAFGPSHPTTASGLERMAAVRFMQRRYSEAKPLFKRALAVFERVFGPDHQQTADGLMFRATMFRAEKDWTSAAADFRKTCASYSRRASPVTPLCHHVLGDTILRWSLEASGKAQLETLRAEGFVVAQQAGDGRTSAAFARGAAQAAAKRQGAGEIARRLNDVRNRLAALDGAFDAAAARGGADAAQVLVNLIAERERLQRERDEVEAELRAKAPEFFDLINPQPVRAEELQKANLLRPDEALIVLVPGFGTPNHPLGRHGLIFAVTRTKIAWAALPNTVDFRGRHWRLEDLIGALHNDMNRGLASARFASFDREIAHTLYKALFESSAEIKAVLADPAIKSWTIAPQGVFLAVPYAALVIKEPHGPGILPIEMRNTSWLGLERAVSVVPSVSSLKTARQKSQAGKPTAHNINMEFLGFGDPDFARTNETREACPQPSQDDRGGTPAIDTFFRGADTDPKSVRELARLPATCREIKALAQAFKAPRANVVLGAAASEPGVRSHARLAHAGIIAFATHGLIAGSFQNTLAQPALALTPPAATQGGASAADNDGLLTASDVTALDLSADWVLLSACNTAARDGSDPDGLSGLARAFFYAGAKSLLVSHWAVDDTAAMRLTTVAAQLQANDFRLTRAAALSLSMSALMRDESNPRFAHPAFWAPFFVVSPE